MKAIGTAIGLTDGAYGATNASGGGAGSSVIPLRVQVNNILLTPQPVGFCVNISGASGSQLLCNVTGNVIVGNTTDPLVNVSLRYIGGMVNISWPQVNYLGSWYGIGFGDTTLNRYCYENYGLSMNGGYSGTTSVPQRAFYSGGWNIAPGDQVNGVICLSQNATFYPVNVSNQNFSASNVTVNTSQATIRIDARKIFLGTSVYPFNATNKWYKNTSAIGSTNLPANNGSNNILLETAGYYTKNVTCAVTTPLTTSNCFDTDVYNGVYVFNATEVVSGEKINNFSLRMYNSSLGGLLTDENTTAGLINVSLLQGYTYLFEFYIEDGSFERVNVSLPSNTSSHYYQFDVLPAPSIDVTIRDADTGALVLDNISIQFVNNVTGVTNYTTTGGFFSGSMPAGDYDIKLDGANYTQTTYALTLSLGEVYFLTAYMTYAPNTVIFEFVDSINTQVLEGVSVSQEKIVGSSWAVISTKITDVTGRTSFDYADDTGYRFTATKTGYGVKIFELDPVLYDDYRIKMIRDSALDFEQEYQSVFFMYEPTIFYDGRANAMNITFTSPTGIFTTYTYDVAYPGGHNNNTGNNAVGETFSDTLTIVGSSLMDRVWINLSYMTTFGEQHNFSYSHLIVVAPGNNTFIAIKDNTYGLGLIERLLIGTIIAVVLAGLATLFGGPLAGLTVALFTFGFFYYIGFWPWYSIGISLVVGFAIMLKRDS